MQLTNKQVSLISSLINEGISAQKGSDTMKIKYLENAQSELVGIYKENQEEVPSIIEMMIIPVLSIGNGDNKIDSSYPDYHVTVMVQILKDIRDEYYLEQQLCESQNQTCLTRWALIVSLATLLATILSSLIFK